MAGDSSDGASRTRTGDLLGAIQCLRGVVGGDGRWIARVYGRLALGSTARRPAARVRMYPFNTRADDRPGCRSDRCFFCLCEFARAIARTAFHPFVRLTRQSIATETIAITANYSSTWVGGPSYTAEAIAGPHSS
jgi:hypothetical protein